MKSSNGEIGECPLKKGKEGTSSKISINGKSTTHLDQRDFAALENGHKVGDCEEVFLMLFY
jgi:hypothetical protein